MKSNFIIIIFLFFVLTIECFAIRPPKPGFKPSPDVVKQFQNIQQSYSTGYWAEKIDARFQLLQDNPNLLKANPKIATDTTYAPTLLGYFTDLSPTYSRDAFQAQLWSGPNPYGTITDYYLEVSYGQMYLTGNCEGWYPVNEPLSAYSPGGAEGGPKFVYETLVASDATVDYRNYIEYYDEQNNGRVPFLVVVHTGGDAAAGALNIWSHRWDFRNYTNGQSYTTDDILPNGKRVIVDGPYAIQPEMTGNQNSGGAIEPIGVFVHELGHVFNLPDLYDYSNRGEGLGGWCLMASGSYGGDQRQSNKPSHMSAWCKEKMGWVMPTVVTSELFNTVLNPVEFTPQIFKLWHNGTPGREYFLIENRQKLGFDISLLESGLLIYHVDENNGDQTNPDHYMVDLEQADGTRGLNVGSNRGDTGDPYPGRGGANNPNIVFDGYSTPSSKDWYDSLTGVNINNVRIVDTLIYANITVWDTATVTPAYSNVTSTAGVSDSSESYGVSCTDYDNDGWMDIYVANATTNRLYKNNGNGTFTNTASNAGVADIDPSRSAIWADVNNDGLPDLYVTTYNPFPLIKKRNKLFRNNGDGTFTNDTTSVLYFYDKTNHAAFADYNYDGNIDVFVLNEYNKSNLYKNNGDGSFTLDTLSGFSYQAKGSSATWGDFNNDSYADLYIVTKDPYVSSALWKNNGDGTFTNLTAIAGVENLAYGQSAAWGDFNNDGFLDIAVCNVNAPNKLYKNNGDETFTDVAALVGVSDGGINYSPLWIDYDLDGYLDLYITRNGPNRLFRNNGNNTFAEVAGRMGISTSEAIRGITLFDFDKNGLPDMYLSNVSSYGPDILYKHTESTNNWLTVTVHGVQSNRDGIGTRITVVANSLKQTREVHGASGFMSQNSLTQFFGFGNTTLIDSLIVRFPSGKIYTGENIATNQNLLIDETMTTAEEIKTTPTDFKLSQNYPNPFNPSTIITFQLPAEYLVTLKIYNVLGQEVTILVDDFKKTGSHKVVWNATGLASGIYFYKLTASGYTSFKKMLLVR